MRTSLWLDMAVHTSSPWRGTPAILSWWTAWDNQRLSLVYLDSHARLPRKRTKVMSITIFYPRSWWCWRCCWWWRRWLRSRGRFQEIIRAWRHACDFHQLLPLPHVFPLLECRHLVLDPPLLCSPGKADAPAGVADGDHSTQEDSATSGGCEQYSRGVYVAAVVKHAA